MVALTQNPFFLNDEGRRWVRDTLSTMTLDEKVGQLFLAIGLSEDDQDILDMERRLHIGGIMYRPHPAKKLKERNDKLQAQARIPLLIAANLEAGGSGALTEGTPFGSQMQIAATGRRENARKLGWISGAEAAAVGVNFSFAPVCDIDRNWRSPITNTRTYGSDPETVLTMSAAYMEGIAEHNIAVSIKHFPGFAGGARCRDWVVDSLTRAGFEVDVFDVEHSTLHDTEIPEDTIRAKYDVIMYFSNVINASYQTVTRIQWKGAVAQDGPFYVREVPTLFVSLGNPYGFIDVPMIRTIINAYNASPFTVQAAVDRITGKEPFTGLSPVDPFCGMFGKDI